MADDRSLTDTESSRREKEKKLAEEPSHEQDTVETNQKETQPVNTDSSAKAQELLDRVLRFLSTASNETLGACMAGLGAVTYLILGRLGLVLIGALGGIVLHATWEEAGARSNQETSSAEEKARRKREDGFNVLQRALDWRGEIRHPKSDSDESVNKVQVEISTTKPLDFSNFEPSVSAALTTFTDAVIRDYVSELTNALTVSGHSEAGSADVLHQYLLDNPSSSLANVVDTIQQKRKLKDVSEDILRSFLDPKAYNCEPVRVFLRQILSGMCLEMSVQTCSEPDWINGWIVYLLEQDEPGLMDGIDAGVEDTTAIGSKESNANISDLQGMVTGPTADAPPKTDSGHRKTVSRAEEAMDEAMQEAKRLSEMIAAEEAKKARGNQDTISSGTITEGDSTPASSQSDLGVLAEQGTIATASAEVSQDSPAEQPAKSETISSFTNFDQLLNSQTPTALQSSHVRTQSVVLPLTLHNASISIFDDTMPGDKGILRSKPTVDYLLQVEPATSQHPGWMIARKYADFETLHEVLRRISVISGAPEFADKHAAVPGWKNRSKEVVRVDLERYLRDALSFNRLAESEGMKRFLEKDQGLGSSSPNSKQGGFGFPTPAAFESMGKGMLDVLSAGPKSAAGGGKAILGGVTGVLGGVGSFGQKKQAPNGNQKPAQSSNANSPRTESNKPWANDTQPSRESQDRSRTSLNELDRATTLPPEFPPRSIDNQPTIIPSQVPSLQPTSRRLTVNDLLTDSIPISQTSQVDKDTEGSLHLPPPPSEIPDDWTTSSAAPRKFTSSDNQTTASSTSRPKPPKPPLTEKETRVAIELFFATITSLYTLSSAWSIRRTLLTAAKNFLLRPGNPNLEAIRALIQDTVLDANVSDAGLAAHIHKIRENALPTEAELKSWPPPPSEEEKARLRVKARKLLVEKGMPPALTSVMGQAASGEALGRVFDALQVEEVARGMVFALVLQGVKAVVQ
ncbi:MAG: hypothetical protein Q9219_006554 [cf. Caloplaca sp. 3 TL-2023]